MSLTKKNGEYQLLIEINEDAPTNIHGLKDIWHWTCYHTFHFAIVRLGFDKIDWLSAKSIALIITKKILKKVFTGGIPGLIVTFLWVEVAHKHVGSFAQHGSNRICGTDYSNIDNKFSKALKFGETSRNRSRNKPSPQGVKSIRG
jgi:hypothetical protein